MKNIVAVICILTGLTACSKNEVVSNATLEDARAQARENGMYNAQKFKVENKAYSRFDIYNRGDSTQDASCPQGDGWVSIDLRDSNGQTVQKLKCSTVSVNLGCLEAEDFKTKPYAAEEGRCNPTLSFPIPKLSGK